MNTLKKNGFTLIELLVVISIIGILASIVLVSLDGTRKKGRDSKRISDVKQIQLALELYYDQNNAFPASISTVSASCSQPAGQSCASLNLTGPGYISVVPTDPSNNRDYSYTPYYASGGTNSVCSSYHLGTSLETLNHTVFQNDKDQTASALVCNVPNAASVDFDGTDLISGNGHKCNNNDFGVECYDVTP